MSHGNTAVRICIDQGEEVHSLLRQMSVHSTCRALAKGSACLQQRPWEILARTICALCTPSPERLRSPQQSACSPAEQQGLAHTCESSQDGKAQVANTLHHSNSPQARAGASDSADAGVCGTAQGKAAMLRRVRAALAAVRHCRCSG